MTWWYAIFDAKEITARGKAIFNDEVIRRYQRVGDAVALLGIQ